MAKSVKPASNTKRISKMAIFVNPNNESNEGVVDHGNGESSGIRPPVLAD